MASSARARSADAASATTATTADATSTMFDLGKFGARGADARATRGTAVPAARGAGGGDDAVDASGAGDARARARATRATGGGKEDGLLEETGRGTLNPFDMDGSERETVRLKPGMTRGQFALLLASECALAVGLFALYTMIGFGDDVYSELANDGNWRLSWAIAGGSMALFAVLWILDAMEAARSRGRAIRRTVTFLFASVGVGGLVVSGMLSVKEYETLPLSFYVLFKAGLIRVFKGTVCKRTHNGSFLRHVAYASYFVSFASLTAWIVWVFGWDKKWSKRLFDEFSLRLGCDTTSTNGSSNAGDGEAGGCDNVAYIMYAAPLAVSALNLVYGLSCTKLSKQSSALQLIAILAVLVAFGTWVSVSLSAIEMGVANDVIQLAVVFCAIFGVACLITAGPHRIYRQLNSYQLTKKVVGYTQTDLAKALLFCCTMTLLPFTLAISAVSAAARRVGLTLHKPPPDAPKDGFLTYSTYALFAWWFADPTKIFKYSAYLSIFYFTFSIGVGKGAILFLAWLVDVLGSLNEYVVIGVFIAIGVGMFLLPPVPGPPIYLTGGILVVGTWEPKIGFWPAAFLCCLVCWFTKLFSCALQQKLIGEQMGKKPSIRYAVGINSLNMRAIRYCLEQKGFSRAKIAILCGGPDWPTSVLCGILKLDLLQIMIGTMPVLVLYLGYTTIAGALQLKVGSCGGDGAAASDSSSWGLLNSMFLALAFVSMLCTSLSAVYYMEQTVLTKREELDAMPIDEEVEELERLDRAKEEAYAAVTDWNHLSTLSKVSIVVAAVSGVLSCQLGAVLSQRSFESFSVSCPVAVKDVVKPTGWVSVGLIVVCTIFTSIFRSIAKKNVRSVLNVTQSAAQATATRP
jgi:hypothetical protein